MFKFPEDIFITKLYSSGVLRYAESNNDMDMSSRCKYTKKGPQTLGNQDNRRIPIRQRALHPSMLGWIDVAETSQSDPGQSGSLSPYCKMTSMYFDDSLYENKMHYKIEQYLNEAPLKTLERENEEDWETVRFICDNEEQYNSIMDKLCHYPEGKIQMYGTSNNPMEIIIEKDPREKYRKFDESLLMNSESESINKSE